MIDSNSCARNINVFALAFVIAFCMVTTFLDMVLLKFLVFWHKFRGILAPRIDAWIQDGTFQLQRRAYEMQGEGIWENLEKEVPLTAFATELSTLPVQSRHLCDCPPYIKMGIQPLSTATTFVSQASSLKKQSRSPILKMFRPEGTDSYPTSPSNSSKGQKRP